MNDRNLPCACGSGTKSKRCCQNPAEIKRKEREATRLRIDAMLRNNKSFQAELKRMRQAATELASDNPPTI